MVQFLPLLVNQQWNLLFFTRSLALFSRCVLSSEQCQFRGNKGPTMLRFFKTWGISAYPDIEGDYNPLKNILLASVAYYSKRHIVELPLFTDVGSHGDYRIFLK